MAENVGARKDGTGCASWQEAENAGCDPSSTATGIRLLGGADFLATGVKR